MKPQIDNRPLFTCYRVHYEDEDPEVMIGHQCFAGIKGKVRQGHNVTHVDYMWYVSPKVIEAFEHYGYNYDELVKKYISVLLSIKAYREIISEYTELPVMEMNFEEEDYPMEHSIRVQVEGIHGEYWLNALQALRVLQERGPSLVTFADALAEGFTDYAALLYAFSVSTHIGGDGKKRCMSCYSGHSPTNGNFSTEFALKFADNPDDVLPDTKGDFRKMDDGGGLIHSDRAEMNKNKEEMYSLMKNREAPIRVAVYGTLRRGEGNSLLLKGHAMRWYGYISAPLRMVNLGAFPALIPTSFDDLRRIFVEVYHVDKDTFKSLDRLEGYPNLYDRKRVFIQGQGFVWIYYMHESRGEEIRSGNWLRRG